MIIRSSQWGLVPQAYVLSLLLSLSAWTPTADAKASFASRNSGGLGFTDNANLESSDKDSDLFYTLRTRNRMNFEPWTAGLSIQFTDFFTQNINDALGWRAFLSHSAENDWTFEGSLFGQNFLNGAPGFSENSFSYTGLGLAAEKDVDLGKSTDLTYRPFYEYRAYSALAGRKDHTLGIQSTITFAASEPWSFDGHGELGKTFSSLDEFDHAYLELGAGVDYDLSPISGIWGNLAIRTANYGNRVLTRTSIVGSRRNQRTVTQASGTETLSDVVLAAGYMHRFTPNLEFNGSWTMTSRRSQSDTQNFTMNELLASITLTL